MNRQKIGPVEVIEGERGSRIPYSATLLIHGRDHSALIDCGAGHAALEAIRQAHAVKQIFLTHYHIDHTWGAYLFPEAEKQINPYDLGKVASLTELAKANGVYAVLGEEGAKAWVKKQEQSAQGGVASWKNCLGLIHSSYHFDQVMELAGEKVVMIHAPGHCEGFCCPYFPDYGILLVGDIDLTSFGPWYCNADSQIDLFIQSAKKTLEVEAKYYITSHQKGVVTKEEYTKRLEDYLGIIEKRDEKIKRAIKAGCSPKQLVYQDVFYYKKNHLESRQYMPFEQIGLAKHLKRLIHQGEPYVDYYQQFITEHHMFEEYIDYLAQE
ncbi:MBL fold metallo-hydrolase [Brevibacillus sp. B_LB10_24]|uniref:MBL fold metallo-hydrolase n=1 Tax=Brevibacillus sp. B_LB10_24 TaxID=3380645 RepID=UPI0038B89938